MRRDELERGLDEEIQFHIDRQTEKNMRAGLSPAEARRQALVQFGGREAVKERTRDQFRPVILEDWLRDLRYSVRSLRRVPGFTTLASVTLALGIGATTAVFSVVNGVLIKPLPYPDSEALVAVWHTAPGLNAPQLQLSASQYFTYRDENRTFEELGLWTIGPRTVTGFAEPEEVRALFVTDGALQALGVQPATGRWFSQEEHTPASPETAMLTYGYRQRRYGEILDRMAAIPGVSASSFITTAPMGGFNSFDPIFVEGRQPVNGELPVNRRFKFVSPGFFRTIGTPLVAGRDYSWMDLHERRAVAIISENLAREIWREPSAAVGKRIRENPNSPWREIVGVVGDLYDDGVHMPAPAIVYWPTLMENFWWNRIVAQRLVAFAVRSDRVGTESFLKELQEAIWEVDPSRPLGVRTLGDAYHGSFARTSFTLIILAIAAGMALLLGLVGIYGVLAYSISQRTREIGIRVALGAQRGQLKRLFVRHGLALAAAGMVCGLVAAVLLTRLMTSLLFGITPLDPVTYGAVSLALMSAAALASYLPARRATRVDPVVALRAE